MSEERLTELEMRYTLQQDHLQQLSDVVLSHEREIEKLRRELEGLRGKLQDGGAAFDVVDVVDADDKPPHY